MLSEIMSRCLYPPRALSAQISPVMKSGVVSVRPLALHPTKLVPGRRNFCEAVGTVSRIKTVGFLCGASTEIGLIELYYRRILGVHLFLSRSILFFLGRYADLWECLVSVSVCDAAGGRSLNLQTGDENCFLF